MTEYLNKQDLKTVIDSIKDLSKTNAINAVVLLICYTEYVYRCKKACEVPDSYDDYHDVLCSDTEFVDNLLDDEKIVPAKDYSKPLAMALDTLNLAILSTPTGELRDLITQRVITIQNLL